MLRLAFGETEVMVHTTSTLSRLLAATHRSNANPPMSGHVEKCAGGSVTVEIAPPSCAPEFALRDAQREIAAKIAAHHGWYAFTAVVIERNGRALALLGAGGGGKSTIAAHLLARGWRLVSDDVAFVDETCSTVAAHQSLMTFRSGAIPYLPSSFRATLERSRWFVDERGELRFYEVDPAGVFGTQAWSTQASLTAILIIDGGAGAGGVEAIRPQEITLIALDGRTLPIHSNANLFAGVIKKQPARRTADHIERWYDERAT